MEHSSITIHASHHSYSVIVDEGIRKEAHALISQHVKKEPTRYFIITDDQVAKLYLKDVLASFPKEVEVGHVVLPHGEEAKSFNKYEEVITEALSFHLDRRSLLIGSGWRLSRLRRCNLHERNTFRSNANDATSTRQ